MLKSSDLLRLGLEHSFSLLKELLATHARGVRRAHFVLGAGIDATATTAHAGLIALVERMDGSCLHHSEDR